jgi:hypothetical protein
MEKITHNIITHKLLTFSDLNTFVGVPRQTLTTDVVGGHQQTSKRLQTNCKAEREPSESHLVRGNR